MGTGAEGLGEWMRELAPRLLSVVYRRYGDFAAAEDAVQEAFLAAAAQWPKQGEPREPAAWLLQVACRRRVDSLRRARARRLREEALARERPLPIREAAAGSMDDETLELLFLCCHPALTAGSAVALTLRAVGGLATGEIARAFLVPEATMGQRISRAKQIIRSVDVRWEAVAGKEREARLARVLQVIYLMFNEGYVASAGETLERRDLSSEAIRLARLVSRVAEDCVESHGLLALLLLTDARREARTGAAGELIPLDEQNRGKWDRAQIEEGVRILTGALKRAAAGPYCIQAAIAAVHDEAERAEDTDWPQILGLYEVLGRMRPDPLVALNRAVALAMVKGPEAGLRAVAEVESSGRLSEYHRVAAVKAHLLERMGRGAEAAEQYRVAAAKTGSMPERNFLLQRAARWSR